ncbi:MAG: putative transposase [Bradyrhizobium sp.]|jgi:putative transposase
MSHYRRSLQPGESYFFTVITYQHRSILCDKPICHVLKKVIAKVRANRPSNIDAWILLPDYMHCIWTLPQDDADFPACWRRIKSHVSKACREQCHRQDPLPPSKKKHREATAWQRRFLEHRTRNENDFAGYLDYIHHNPVKHGLMNNAVAWPYPGIHRDLKTGNTHLIGQEHDNLFKWARKTVATQKAGALGPRQGGAQPRPCPSKRPKTVCSFHQSRLTRVGTNTRAPQK